MPAGELQRVHGLSQQGQAAVELAPLDADRHSPAAREDGAHDAGPVRDVNPDEVAVDRVGPEVLGWGLKPHWPSTDDTRALWTSMGDGASDITFALLHFQFGTGWRKPIRLYFV